MKCVEKMPHNHADKLVPLGLLDEILAAIAETQGNAWEGLHKALQAALEARGWQREARVAPPLKTRFDAFKDSIAVEIEFGLRDYAFREWTYFEKAHVAGLVTAGVHIVRCKPGDSANCSAKWARATLQSFSDVFSVPVLILGVDL
jgi:hypothetical protein